MNVQVSGFWNVVDNSDETNVVSMRLVLTGFEVIDSIIVVKKEKIGNGNRTIHLNFVTFLTDLNIVIVKRWVALIRDVSTVESIKDVNSAMVFYREL